MKLPVLTSLFTAAALLLAAPRAAAQIVRLDLEQMVVQADDAIFGTIVGREVIRIDHPVAGPELYYTILTIEGTSLRTSRSLTTQVIHPGGFVAKGAGVFNSVAPAADDVKLGNKVVAFSKFTDNMGGGLSGNALYAARGGLYRTFDARKGVIVQGRGEGYAIAHNVTLGDLQRQVERVRK